MSISTLDLNLFVVLDAVLAEGGVARAARRLHVTPSAISNALARLRDLLEDPLLVRNGRGVVPTPRALALGPVIARALRDLEEAVHGGGFDPLTADRQLTVAMADVVQIVKLPGLAAALASRMPRARLRVLSIDGLHAAGGLAGTEVDAVIGAGQPGPGVRVRPLYQEQIVLVARAGQRAVRRRVTRAQLGALRHVDVQVATGMGNQRLIAGYAALGLERAIAATVPTFTAAAAMVAGTDLVASLPASLVDVLGSRLGLRRIETPLAPVRTQINLLWHQRTQDDPALRLLREVLAGAAAD